MNKQIQEIIDRIYNYLIDYGEDCNILYNKIEDFKVLESYICMLERRVSRAIEILECSKNIVGEQALLILKGIRE